MRQQPIAQLIETGQATQVVPPFTREQIYDIAIAEFARNLTRWYASPRFIEWTPRFLLRYRSVKGTALDPIVTALSRAGVRIQPTMQGVMDALGIDQRTLHDMACYCHHPTNSGMVLEDQLKRLKAGMRPNL